MLRKFTNRKGFTLVELMIVVAIIGILAAIAIPAFLRSVKKSKTAESEQNMKKIADGAKTYFMGEQKSEPAQPWHTAVADPGYPVPWASYSFPGGGSVAQYQTMAAIPTGGSKLVPDPCTPGATGTCPVLNKLGVDFKDPLYFQYTYAQEGFGATASVTITAIANFNPGVAGDHTVSQNVGVGNVDQEVFVTPPFTSNEFN